VNFHQATLLQLFPFTALSGEIASYRALPEIWIIQWERFFRGFEGFNKARKSFPISRVYRSGTIAGASLCATSSAATF
jgi:hypothetical protein